VQYVCDTISEAEIKLIRDVLQRGLLTGSERFYKKYLRDGVCISQIRDLDNPEKIIKSSAPLQG
jgi:hypothetical protein